MRSCPRPSRSRVRRGGKCRWSSKTGSFGGAITNEVGVVELAAGGRCAIAVFTRAHELYERGWDIDDAIGAAAALAVDDLVKWTSGRHTAVSRAMFATLIAGVLLGLGARVDPCAKPLPRGPAVPAPIVLSTDCGWFSLDREGDVARLPRDWYATHKRSWRPPHGLTSRRTRSGRYIVERDGRVIWHSRGRYFNEAGTTAFGPNAFAFDSYGRRGVLATDLRAPERLVLQGRNRYPIGFTSSGELLVSGPRKIVVLSRHGRVVRSVRFRGSSSFVFDQETETVYFVTPQAMLTAVHGSSVRHIGKIDQRGWIGLLGNRLLTFRWPGHIAFLRRNDAAVVASSSWRGSGRDVDAVDVSDDGRLFAFRVSSGQRRGIAAVYVLRAGEHAAHIVYRHRVVRRGCGYAASVDWQGSSLLYRSDDGSGVAEVAVVAPDRSSTRLTPLLAALPRVSRATPGNALWATAFLP